MLRFLLYLPSEDICEAKNSTSVQDIIQCKLCFVADDSSVGAVLADGSAARASAGAVSAATA